MDLMFQILTVLNFMLTAAIFLFLRDFSKEVLSKKDCKGCREKIIEKSNEEMKEFLKPRPGGVVKNKAISFTDEELFNRELHR